MKRDLSSVAVWVVLITLESNGFGQTASNPDVDKVTWMDNQMVALYYQGQSTQALALAIQTLKLSEDTLGPEHPMTTTCLNDLGWIYKHLGRYTNAEPVFKRCLEIRERILGPEHPYTAISLHNLADLFMQMGKYSIAEPLFQRSLAINEKVFGPESINVATSLAVLAVDENYLGMNAKAEALMQRRLAIYEKLEGPDHPDTGRTLQSLGAIYYQMGDLAKSESYHQRALAVQEKNPGPEHPDIAVTLGGLGLLYMDMGDYEKAEALIQRALKIDEKVLGPGHPDTANTIGKLAGLYEKKGNYAQAILLGERVLSIDEKTLGPEHPTTAIALHNVSGLYLQLGNYSQAESYAKRDVNIQEKVLAPDHPLIAASLHNLASVYLKMGNFTTSKLYMQRAAEIDEAILGPNNPATAICLGDLAVVNFDLQKTNEALLYADKAERAQLAILDNILSFTSEQHRLNYEAQHDPYVLFASLNNARRIALAILRHKGVVLDSLLEDQIVAQANQNPENRKLIEQLGPAKQRLTQLLMADAKDLKPDTLKSRDARRDQLTRQVERLEGDLAQKVAGFGHSRRALKVTVEQVQKAISPQAVLLEFIRYEHYLGHQRWENRYGAVVLSSKGDPKWVCLGAVTDIEKNVLFCQQAVRNKQQGDEATLSQSLHQLYKQIWEPVDALFPRDTKTVVISQDASLNFISFATLLTSHDQFLAEKYSIRYVASGRDLLLEPVKSLNQKMVVFAAPDYNAGAQTHSPQTGLQLVPLPYFARNATELESLAKGWNWPVQVYSGIKATETQLRGIHSPRILHFATHGFFLPDTIKGPDRVFWGGFSLGSMTPHSRILLQNPMSRSGVALAGAQVTLDAWQRGEVPATDSDGILTAEEAGGLDLQGTWLVVLSACDTGIGKLRFGEGVMGLRRGFIQAGAQNLLMTLWPVYDVPSGELMLKFYSTLHQDNNPSEALAEVQRDSLVKLRSKYGLLPAVIMAGAFIVSSQGPLQ